MADFKKRFKDLLGFTSTESVAYDTTDDTYDYSDYDETDDFATDETSDEFVSSDYDTTAYAGSSSSFKSKSSISRSSSNISGSSSERSRVLSMGSTSNLKVVLSKPLEYDDCQAIGSHLRGHMTVVLNLELVKNVADRRRIYDFVAGCCYALDCNMQRVSEMIYVIAPMEVDIFSEAEDDEEEDTYSMV